MPPAARVSDIHVCPMVTGVVPHVGGPILPPGSIDTLIEMLPAARVTVMGSTSVIIDFLPAARLGDPTAHGGVIIPPCALTVIIGG
jgi:uncharacterized Zn-binding protein involved in type VI secretion